ncbi:OmpA family protein [Flavobacterium sp. UBA7680]|uniref:OmpA family protein n=1 Tax=Flavobacterium sp. UBA7680 TaxID=1946559 RepID=UPI0025C2E090|nr:OmpA family protein [Flavobacterium sp. UBA7680]
MKKILVLLCLWNFQQGIAQSQCDNYYKINDFFKAASCYEEQLLSGDHKKEVILKLANSYYNTYRFESAAMYLKKIVTGRFDEPNKNYPNYCNMMYFHVLSALGNHPAAVDYIVLFYENLGISLDKKSVLENIEEFKLKDDLFKIQSVSFNTEFSDFGAVKVDDTIYFSSDRPSKFDRQIYKWTHRPFLDIFKASKKEKDTTYTVEVFPEAINTELHEANFCFTKDGNTMYFSGSNFEHGRKKYDKKDNNNIKIYKSTKVNGQWTPAQKMAFNKNNCSIMHPALSPDEKRLYFASNFGAEVSAAYDLYYVELEGENKDVWVRLPEPINTAGREQYPYLDAQGNLYFSSAGHLGLGMLDVFVCKNINGSFEYPINLGAPINSSFDDFAFRYSDDKNGYFASNRDYFNDDIYEFTQLNSIFKKQYTIAFEIRDSETKQYVADCKAILKDKNQKQIYCNTLDSIAVFNLNIYAGIYDLKVEHQNYEMADFKAVVQDQHQQKLVFYIKQKVKPIPVLEPEEVEEQKDPVAYAEKKKEIKKQIVADTSGPKVIEKDGKMFFELEPIHFDYDKWTIRADSKKILDALAEKMEKYPSVHLKIVAHTDNRGTELYNQILSEKRAEATRNYLALEGYVNARRMKFVGMGESKPLLYCLDFGCNEHDHFMNRRCEFEIIKY